MMIFILTLFMVRYHLGLKIMRKQKKKRFQLDIRYSLFVFGPPNSLPEHNISVVGNRNYSEPYLIPMQ